MGDTLVRDLEAMKFNIENSGTPEFYRIKVISLGLVESGKEGSGLTHRVRNGGRTTTNLKPRG